MLLKTVVFFALICLSFGCTNDEVCNIINDCSIPYCNTTFSECEYEYLEKGTPCENTFPCAKISMCDGFGSCYADQNICESDDICIDSFCNGIECVERNKCNDFDLCTTDICSETGECSHEYKCSENQSCKNSVCVDIENYCTDDNDCNHFDMANSDLCLHNTCADNRCITKSIECPENACFENKCSSDTGLCTEKSAPTSYCSMDCSSSICHWRENIYHENCIKDNDKVETNFCGKTETEMFSNLILNERSLLEQQYLSFANNICSKNSLYTLDEKTLAFDALKILSENCNSGEELNNIYVELAVKIMNIIYSNLCCCEISSRTCDNENIVDDYHQNVEEILAKNNYNYNTETGVYEKGNVENSTSPSPKKIYVYRGFIAGGVLLLVAAVITFLVRRHLIKKNTVQNFD